MRKRIHYWCSVVPEKTQPWVHRSVENSAMERWALRLGLFCPHWTPMMNYLSHTPVPALGKDKKRTAARWPHVDP